MFRVLTLFFFSCVCLSIHPQNATYRILDLEMEGSTDVRVDLMVYCKKKKKVAYEAKLAALRTVLYSGVGRGVFAKALMPEGEITSFQSYPLYMESLYNYRLDDFIEYNSMTSDFKKGDNYQGTRFLVCVKALKLRVDLEKNQIVTKMGL